MRKSYGIGHIIKLLRDKNFKEHWEIIKATVGLIKNLASSETIIPYLCEQSAVQKLVELLVNLDRERVRSGEENTRYDALMEVIVATLTMLSKYPTCRSILKDMNCMPVLMRVCSMFSHVCRSSGGVCLAVAGTGVFSPTIHE